MQSLNFIFNFLKTQLFNNILFHKKKVITFSLYSLFNIVYVNKISYTLCNKIIMFVCKKLRIGGRKINTNHKIHYTQNIYNDDNSIFLSASFTKFVYNHLFILHNICPNSSIHLVCSLSFFFNILYIL